MKASGNFDTTAVAVESPFPLGQQDVLDLRAIDINFDKLTRIANTEDFGGIGTSSGNSVVGMVYSKGVLEVPDATFNDIPLGVLTGNYRYQAGRIFIENGLLMHSGQEPRADSRYESRATINGTVDVKGEFPAAFSIVADPVYVQHYSETVVGGGISCGG